MIVGSCKGNNFTVSCANNMNDIFRSYALAPGYEAATRPIEEALPNSKGESDETDSKEVVLPGVNMIFDGTELHPFDIGACQQARQPIALVAEAAAASAAATK